MENERWLLRLLHVWHEEREEALRAEISLHDYVEDLNRVIAQLERRLSTIDATSLRSRSRRVLGTTWLSRFRAACTDSLYLDEPVAVEAVFFGKTSCDTRVTTV
jgi:hypothetical protein